MTYLDTYFGSYRLYRMIRKGNWFKHQYTKDAIQISYSLSGTFWCRYDDINKYSKVILKESF